MLNGEQHIAKSSAVGFINNKHQPLAADLLDVSLIDSFFRLDITHFLNGGNDQAVAVLFAFQLGEQNGGVFRCLHIVLTVGKILIFLQRLLAQLNTVEQENHLIRIFTAAD